MGVTAEIHRHKNEETNQLVVFKFDRKPAGEDLDALSKIGEKLKEERKPYGVMRYDMVFDLTGNQIADLFTLIPKLPSLGVFLSLFSKVMVVNTSPEHGTGNGKSQIRFFTDSFQILQQQDEEAQHGRLESVEKDNPEIAILLRLYLTNTLGNEYDLYKVL